MSGTTEGIYTESKQHRRLMAQIKPSRQQSHVHTRKRKEKAEKAAQLGWQMTGNIVDMDKGTKGKEEVPGRQAHACNLAHQSAFLTCLPHQSLQNTPCCACCCSLVICMSSVCRVNKRTAQSWALLQMFKVLVWSAT